MKKIFFYSLSLFILSSLTKLNAQESKPVPNDNPALKEAAMKANARRIEKKKNYAQNTVKQVDVNPLDENDIYMGRKNEFLGNLTTSELPADFPKYDKSYGLRYYNNLVDNYYGAHKDILKPRVREKIEYHYPSAPNQQLNTK